MLGTYTYRQLPYSNANGIFPCIYPDCPVVIDDIPLISAPIKRPRTPRLHHRHHLVCHSELHSNDHSTALVELIQGRNSRRHIGPTNITVLPISIILREFSIQIEQHPRVYLLLPRRNTQQSDPSWQYLSHPPGSYPYSAGSNFLHPLCVEPYDQGSPYL